MTAQFPDITIDLQSLANSIVGITLPSTLSGTISISDLSLSGTVTSTNDVQLIVTATSGSTDIYIIYQKEGASTAKKAIAVEISNVRLSSIFQDATRLDITQVPYFGSINANIGLTIATTNIDNLPDDLFATSSLLSMNGNSIEGSFTAFIVFGFSTATVKVHYSGGAPSFQPVSPASISVNDLLSAIPGVDVSSIPLPSGIGGFPQLRIDSFVLDLQTRAILFTISYPNSLTYFDGLLRVDNPMLTINASRQGVEIDIDGDLSISGSGFAVTIDRDEASNNYVLTANADELPITNLVSQFQSEVLPSELNALLSSLPFFSFSIDDPSISFPLSSSPLQIQLGGTPVISGYNTAHMASVIIRQGRKTLLVQGFELGSVNLATFLKSITGFNFNSIALLNQDLEAVILISPVTLPNVQLTGNRLSSFAITKGVSVQASMQFPAGCSSDAFCACLLYTSPSPRDATLSRMPSSA